MMIILKTTFHIDEDVHEQGLKYIKETYVRDVMASEILYSPTLSRIFVQYEEVGASYSLKFRIKDKPTLDKWVADEGGALQKDMFKQFGDKIAAFVTVKRRIEL